MLLLSAGTLIGYQSATQSHIVGHCHTGLDLAIVDALVRYGGGDEWLDAQFRFVRPRTRCRKT